MNLVRLVLIFYVLAFLKACTFSFEVTSQKTALENQIMGQYENIDEDIILISTVRSKQAENIEANKVELARANQKFNQDDIDELKDLQIIGEGYLGELKLLSKNITKKEADKNLKELAKKLLAEENRDRRIIWQDTIDSNPNLSTKDLPSVKRTFSEFMKKKAKPGHFIEREKNQWKIVSAEGIESNP